MIDFEILVDTTLVTPCGNEILLFEVGSTLCPKWCESTWFNDKKQQQQQPNKKFREK